MTACVLVVSRRRRVGGGPVESGACVRLRWRYLVVYYLAFLGDWLQGPYVYALYREYGSSGGVGASRGAQLELGASSFSPTLGAEPRTCAPT